MIYAITAMSGIGNRLKNIISAKRIADELSQDFSLYWEPCITKEFKENGQIVRKSQNISFIFDEIFSCNCEILHNKDSINMINNSSIDRSIKDVGLIGWRWAYFADEEKIDIHACSVFSEKQRKQIKLMSSYTKEILTFNNSIKEMADSYIIKNNIGNKTLGLHIRSLHYLHCYKIPIENYLKIFDVVGSYDNIFIATDNLEIRNFFPNAIYYDDNIHGLSEIFDMYILSRCGILVGSEGSTYSEVSWVWNGCKIPYYIVGLNGIRCIDWSAF